jgi:hypothetical protein
VIRFLFKIVEKVVDLIGDGFMRLFIEDYYKAEIYILIVAIITLN